MKTARLQVLNAGPHITVQGVGGGAVADQLRDAEGELAILLNERGIGRRNRGAPCRWLAEEGTG